MPELATAWSPLDGGPTYVETPTDLSQFTGPIAEPWNACSALLFIIISVGWIWVLRGRYHQHPFLCMCIPILFTGGVGGALYHGLRISRVFFLMDVVPIFALGLAVTIWLWVRLGPKLRYVFSLIALIALIQTVLGFQRLPRDWAINVSYGCLALVILTPIAIALVRTRFRYAGWVYTALACFAIAWLFRARDIIQPPLLPMGTHWLWHTFGAVTTLAVSVYVYHIEGMKLRVVR